MHMNMSSDSVENLLAQQPRLEPQRTHEPLRGITRERLDEFERQSPDGRKHTQSFQLMRYLRDFNPSEAIAVGRDSSVTASDKEASMKAYIKAWEVQFEELATKKGG